MKIFAAIKFIFQKTLELMGGCFYLFSAATLTLVCAFILRWGLEKLNIYGTKQTAILWVCGAMAAVYALVKVFLWMKKLCVSIYEFFYNFFRKNTIDENS